MVLFVESGWLLFECEFILVENEFLLVEIIVGLFYEIILNRVLYLMV